MRSSAIRSLRTFTLAIAASSILFACNLPEDPSQQGEEQETCGDSVVAIHNRAHEAIKATIRSEEHPESYASGQMTVDSGRVGKFSMLPFYGRSKYRVDITTWWSDRYLGTYEVTSKCGSADDITVKPYDGYSPQRSSDWRIMTVITNEWGKNLAIDVSGFRDRTLPPGETAIYFFNDYTTPVKISEEGTKTVVFKDILEHRNDGRYIREWRIKPGMPTIKLRNQLPQDAECVELRLTNNDEYTNGEERPRYSSYPFEMYDGKEAPTYAEDKYSTVLCPGQEATATLSNGDTRVVRVRGVKSETQYYHSGYAGYDFAANPHLEIAVKP